MAARRSRFAGLNLASTAVIDAAGLEDPDGNRILFDQFSDQP